MTRGVGSFLLPWPFRRRPRAAAPGEVEPMVLIELSPDEARALRRWLEESDVRYWEIAGLAAVAERLKTWAKYEEWW